MQQGRQRCGKSRLKNEFTFLVKILQMAGFVNSFLQPPHLNFNRTVCGVELRL